MTEPEDIETFRSAAFQRIGRNVFNFQKLEARLKYLVTVNNLEGTVSNLKARLAKKAASVNNQTMGTVAGKFHAGVFGYGCEAEPPGDLAEIWISSSIRIEADPGSAETRKRALSELVLERNDLIHQKLATFDPDSIESCRSLIEVLDQQNERILRQLDDLGLLIRNFKDLFSELRSYLSSEEFLSQLQTKKG